MQVFCDPEIPQDIILVSYSEINNEDGTQQKLAEELKYIVEQKDWNVDDGYLTRDSLVSSADNYEFNYYMLKLNTNKKPIYVLAYNVHNGYYSHFLSVKSNVFNEKSIEL